jgi:hypothetical protein
METAAPVYLEKALLANVSPRLAAHCSAMKKLPIGIDAFRVFAAWIFHRKLRSVEEGAPSWFDQTSLAEAWNLGAEYDIPGLQNSVMRMLVRCFEYDQVEFVAMKEVYRITKRDTELQKALVTQLARDSLDDTGLAWEKKEIKKHGMDKVPGFCLDLAVALTSELYEAGLSLDVDDYLVAEVSPIDEGSDGDESLTDG